MNTKQIQILQQAKKGLGIALLFAILAELIFFPSLANFYGCLMASIAYGVFYYFLQEKYIIYTPFAFCMYLSMFMYRYLPLLATIVEGKPITFGFERPYETFMYEIILFLISSLCFYLACKNAGTKGSNNLIQQVLYRLDFYKTTPTILWFMGLVGLLIRIYNFGSEDVEFGDVGGKFLLGLDYLMYAPLCLVFPSLLKIKYSNRKILIAYGVFIFILNFASNSRRQIIIPIGITLLLFFLYLVKNNLKITDYFSKTKLLFIGIGFVVLLNLLSTISNAMLYTRSLRDDINKVELLKKTIEVSQNKELLKELKKIKETEGNMLASYNKGWTEYYVDNFMLQRYANMRITDETLFYAEKKGYGNIQMQELFYKNIIALFPGPILKAFNIKLDKSTLIFSRGDLLYGSGFGGFRVTSHLADGLATFGYWYFIFQFIATFLVFKLLNTLILISKKGVKYGAFALMNVFTFLGMFRNAQGMIADVGYILRGYLQGIFTYLLIYYLVKYILFLINPRLIK
jgi:hypothetical protein